MRNRKLINALPLGASAFGLLAVAPAFASTPTFFSGIDSTASSISDLNNSKTAQTNFLAAAGTVTTETFEGVNMGGTHAVDVLNGFSDGALSISFGGTSAAHVYDEGISTEQPGNSAQNNGFNTTAGGSKYIFVEPTAGKTATTTFSFTKSVDAFGLYVTGLGNNSLTLNATFNDGTQHAFTVTGTATKGGAEYFGFVDKGAQVSNVTFTENTTSSTRDRYSIDDISYQASPTPEAGTLAILATALGGMMFFSSRRKRSSILA